MNRFALFFTMIIFCAILGVGADTEGEYERAKSLVRAQLKDPDSTQFRDLRSITNARGVDAICGEYNARNSYGGYVGFKRFGVSMERYSTEKRLLALFGCNGPEAELGARFEVEADFNCNVIWTMMDNYFKNGDSLDTALDAAITATVARARENGTTIVPAVLDNIRAQYRVSLKQTESDKKSVKQIKKGNESFKFQFLSTCTMKTVQAMKAQSGVK